MKILEVYYTITVHTPTGDQFVRRFEIISGRRSRGKRYVMTLFKNNSLTEIEKLIPYPSIEEMRDSWNLSMNTYNDGRYWATELLPPSKLQETAELFERKTGNVNSTP